MEVGLLVLVGSSDMDWSVTNLLCGQVRAEIASKEKEEEEMMEKPQKETK